MKNFESSHTLKSKYSESWLFPLSEDRKSIPGLKRQMKKPKTKIKILKICSKSKPIKTQNRNQNPSQNKNQNT